jgi:hypothetical protein
MAVFEWERMLMSEFISLRSDKVGMSPGVLVQKQQQEE